MDPYDTVHLDAQHQLSVLRQLMHTSARIDEIPSIGGTGQLTPQDEDFLNVLEELNETIGDLKDAADVSGIPERQKDVENLRNNARGLVLGFRGQRGYLAEAIEQRLSQCEHGDCIGISSKGTRSTYANAEQDQHKTSDTEDYGGDSYQEMILQEQDGQLGQVYDTVQNIRQQAETMGMELEDQAVILDDLEYGIDGLHTKILRGRKKAEYLYEKNRDTVNNCCIAILTVALVVLLILIIVI